MNKDKTILRDLAQRYAAICASPTQKIRRDLWRKHNSLKETRPLIYVRAFAWPEMPESKCVCKDSLFRQYEDFFRRRLFWDSLNDDSVFEPWVTVQAVHRQAGWGVEIGRHYSGEEGGSYKIDYPLKTSEDLKKLAVPSHEIDEPKTAANVERLQEAIGDLVTINLDRAPFYRMWEGDISTYLGRLRGIENFMADMYDNPAWLHSLVKFISAGVLKVHAEAEAAGDWGLGAHENQAMPYAEELSDPAPNVNGVKRRQLWAFMAAQEFTGVSPAMHNEFLLQYQLPILRHFGLVAYGCCEDLTRKIDMLRQIPNLRRIAVAPAADVALCAEQIGRDYVLSYRPSPADMVSYNFDAARIRKIISRDLKACRRCHVDITLKDVETVEKDPARVRRWVQLTREIISEVWR
ncbi:MAG: hypothetical protein KJ964_11260 [Verrucomicrobia bacterium]|nr:hypothetical protein [Verrucomicrobiota bacterium]MBU1734209.1 hypothetical protein [Verrucomicrobiota bacterium]MBU1855747.1 hypothetical protein [Verrucomicrobiota bacterium]